MPTDSKTSFCPMDPLVRLLGARWTLYIIWLLQNNPGIRFGALMAEVPGISAKMLTERLRALQSAGLVARHVEPTRPPQVSYCLTPQGLSLRNALDGLHRVAVDWQGQGWTPEAGFPEKLAAE